MNWTSFFFFLRILERNIASNESSPMSFILSVRKIRYRIDGQILNFKFYFDIFAVIYIVVFNIFCSQCFIWLKNSFCWILFNFFFSIFAFSLRLHWVADFWGLCAVCSSIYTYMVENIRCRVQFMDDLVLWQCLLVLVLDLWWIF